MSDTGKLFHFPDLPFHQLVPNNVKNRGGFGLSWGRRTKEDSNELNSHICAVVIASMGSLERKGPKAISVKGKCGLQ